MHLAPAHKYKLFNYSNLRGLRGVCVRPKSICLFGRSTAKQAYELKSSL
jgi:hypothetical protein